MHLFKPDPSNCMLVDYVNQFFTFLDIVKLKDWVLVLYLMTDTGIELSGDP